MAVLCGLSLQKKEAVFQIKPANPGLMDELILSTGLISKKAESVSAFMASYKFRGEGIIHSVLVFSPTHGKKISVQQENTPNGVGVLITEENKNELVLLVANPDSESV